MTQINKSWQYMRELSGGGGRAFAVGFRGHGQLPVSLQLNFSGCVHCIQFNECNTHSVPDSCGAEIQRARHTKRHFQHITCVTYGILRHCIILKTKKPKKQKNISVRGVCIMSHKVGYTQFLEPVSIWPGQVIVTRLTFPSRK